MADGSHRRAVRAVPGRRWPPPMRGWASRAAGPRRAPALEPAAARAAGAGRASPAWRWPRTSPSRRAEAEQKIVTATKMALTITASGDPNNPQLGPDQGARCSADPRRHRDQSPLPQDHADGGRRTGALGRLEQCDLDLGIGAVLAAVRRGHPHQRGTRLYRELGNPRQGDGATWSGPGRSQPDAPVGALAGSRSCSAAPGRNARALELARAGHQRERLRLRPAANAPSLLAWRAGDYRAGRPGPGAAASTSWPATPAREPHAAAGHHVSQALHGRGQGAASRSAGMALAAAPREQAWRAQIPRPAGPAGHCGRASER